MMSINNQYYFDDITTVFQFGKHRGESLCTVLAHDPSYIYWCINNIELSKFRISKDALRQIREFFPKFIIAESFRNRIGLYIDANDDEEYDEEYDVANYDNWRSYEERPTYERYGGSYAQDVMGYSDDDIDTIFDGDPSAYWNID